MGVDVCGASDTVGSRRGVCVVKKMPTQQFVNVEEWNDV